MSTRQAGRQAHIRIASAVVSNGDGDGNNNQNGIGKSLISLESSSTKPSILADS